MGQKKNTAEALSENNLGNIDKKQLLSIEDTAKKGLLTTLTSSKKEKISPTGMLIEKMLKQAYEHKNLTEDEEIQIVSQLENMNLEKDWHSKGSEGSVFKIKTVDEKGNTKEYLAAKKRYDNDPNNEWHIHQRVQEILEKNPEVGKVIKVPKLKAVISLSNEENFIIMEFIHEKTLYQLQLESILERWGYNFVDINSDLKAESIFFKALGLNPLNKEDCKKVARLYHKELEFVKLFSSEQGLLFKNALREFMHLIHKEGIYHRDGSNPRNLMVGAESLYVIDYGKSVDIKGTNLTEKDIYEKQEGEITGVFPRDEEILSEITRYTKTQEDLDDENNQKEIHQRNKRIEKSSSIIELLKDIPFDWVKNEKKRENIMQKAIHQASISKQIKLASFELIKNNEEKIILLLSQSVENLHFLKEEIITKKDVLLRQKQEQEIKRDRIPQSALALGEQAINDHKKNHKKKIEKIEANIVALNDIEAKISYLQKVCNFREK